MPCVDMVVSTLLMEAWWISESNLMHWKRRIRYTIGMGSTPLSKRPKATNIAHGGYSSFSPIACNNLLNEFWKIKFILTKCVARIKKNLLAELTPVHRRTNGIFNASILIQIMHDLI